MSMAGIKYQVSQFTRNISESIRSIVHEHNEGCTFMDFFWKIQIQTLFVLVVSLMSLISIFFMMMYFTVSRFWKAMCEIHKKPIESVVKILCLVAQVIVLYKVIKYSMYNLFYPASWLAFITVLNFLFGK